MNGEYVTLEDKKNILFEESHNEDIYFALEHTNSKLDLLYANGFSVGTESNKFLKVDSCGGFNLFFDDMQYICTDRISPMKTYPLSEENIKKISLVFLENIRHIF